MKYVGIAIALCLFSLWCYFIASIYPYWNGYEDGKKFGYDVGVKYEAARIDNLLRKPKADWDAVIKEMEFGHPLLCKQSGVTILSPNKTMTIGDVKMALGTTGQVWRVIKRENEDTSDRPEVLTLHIYDNIVFVESDFSAKPGTIVLVLIGK